MSSPPKPTCALPCRTPPQASGVASPVYSFTTAPAPGAADTLTILLAADTGTGEDEDNALRPTAHKSVGAYAVYKVGRKEEGKGTPAGAG